MQGKAAIVTGGASGLGEATVRAFVDRGVSVCIADVQRAGDVLAKEICEGGGRAIYVPVDVTSTADVTSMVETTTREFGRLDYAYNNAGMVEDKQPAADIPVEVWRRVLDVNLTGVWLCLRAEVPAMIETGGGVIVNTASMAALHGGAAWHIAAYAASKAGVVQLTKVAARDYAMDNIRVISVCPGSFDTPMLRGAMDDNPEWAKKMVASKAMGRLGRPSEIAKTVVWLCSDDASYISGDSIAVDGASYI